MANEFKIKKGLIVTGASGGTVVNVLGSQGQLLSVTDNLSGSIFAVSDISGVPIFDVNSSGLSTFAGNVTIGSLAGGGTSVGEGLNIGNASPTIQLFDTTNNATLLMYTQDSNSVIGTYSNHALTFFTNSTQVLNLDTSQNATFAEAVVLLDDKKLEFGGGGDFKIWHAAGENTYFRETGEGATVFQSNGWYFQNTASPAVTGIHLTDAGAATFAGKATSLATAASDGSTTLTTKSYVDGLVTGVPVYKGTWDARTQAEGGLAGDGGNINLRLAANKILGNYYIVETAGSATPNGANTEPSSWNIGDWCIFSDITSGAGTDLWQRIDNSSVISGAGTGQKVAKWAGATNADSETLTDSSITDTGSAVTIGNPTTITGPLTVNIDANDTVFIKSAGTNASAVFAASGDELYLGGGDSYSVRYPAGNNYALFDNSTPRVGIGTGSPSNLISLKGSGQNYSTSPAIKMWDSHNSKGWYVGTANNHAIGDFYIRSVTSEAAYPVAAGQEFTIKQSGYVGIGTISPGQKLEVSGNTYVTGYVQASSALIGNKVINSVNYATFGSNSTATGVALSRDWDPVTYPDLIINPAGNVGINTASPGAQLEVFGTGNSFRLDSAANGSKEILFRNVGTGTATIKTDGDLKLYTEDAGKNILFNTTGGEKMRIEAGGDVGIGTTSPGSKLELGPNGSLGANITNKNVILNIDGGYGTTGTPSSGQYKVIGFTGTTRDVTDITGQTSGEVQKNFYAGIIGGDYFNQNRFSIWQDGVERLTILGTATGSGNVGIGTASPNEKLQVAGNIHAYAPSGIDAGLFASTAAGSTTIAIRSSGITHFNGGNVGIGITGPNAKLHVMGTTGLPATSGTTFTGTMRLGVTGYGTVLDFGAVGPLTGTQWIQATNAVDLSVTYPLLLNPNGGKVGIGEDAPGTLLSLKSPLANTSIVTLKCSKNDSSWTIGDRIGGINFFGEDGSGQGAGIKGSINYIVASSSGGSNAMTFNVAGTANNQERMRINNAGAIKFNAYDAANNTGTATYLLGTDASGNVVKSNGVPGGTGYAPATNFSRTGINSSSYTMLATVDGNGLASVIQMSVNGTSSSVVINTLFDIAVNHYKDITVRSFSGDYTELTLRITSDNNEDFSIEAKHNGSSTTTVEVWIYPKNGETITPTTTDPGHTGQELVFTATEGTRLGGVDGDGASPSTTGQAVFEGPVGIGTTLPIQKLDTPNIVIGGSTIAGTYRANALFMDNNGGNSRFYSSGADGSTKGSYEFNIMASDANPLSTPLKLNADDSAIFAGNVGIGTNTPLAKLDIQGTQGQLFSVTDDLSGSIFAVADISGVPIFDVNSSGVSYFDGNVGIGTTTPDSKLEVDMTDASGNRVGFIGDGSTTGSALWTNWTTGASYLDFRLGGITSTYTKMRVTSAGNVGIGTTSPTVRLDISGSSGGASVRIKDNMGAGAYYYGYMYDGGNLQGTTQTNIFYAGGSVAANTTITDFASIRIDTPSVAATDAVVTNNYGIYQASSLQKNYFSGNVGIGVTAPGEKLEVAGNITAKAGGDVFVNSIATTTTGRSFIKNIGDTGSVLVSAVYGSASTGTIFGVSATRAASIITTSDTSVHPTSLVIGTFTEIPLYLGTNNSSRITILGNGKVGIGTTNPTQNLHLDGNNYNTATRTTFLIRDVGNNYDQGDNAIDIVMRSRYWSGDQNTSQNSKIRHLKDNSNGSTGTQLRFGTTTRGAGDSSDKMTILASGNVGIGTTSPGAQLHNYSTAATNVFITGEGTAAQNNWGAQNCMFVKTDNGLLISKANAANNTNRIFNFYNDSSGHAQLYMHASATAEVKIDTSGTSYFNGGDIIIGATAINGTFGASNTILAVKGSSSGGEGIIQITGLGNNATDNVGALAFHSQAEAQPMCSIVSIRGNADNVGDMVFKTNNGGTNTERMRIDSTGNLVLPTVTSNIKGGTTAGSLNLLNSDSTAYITVNGSTRLGTPNQISLITTTSIAFYTGSSSTKVMQILSSGNVNIGPTETASSSVTGPLVVTHSSSRFLTSSYEESAVSLSAKNNNNNLETLRLAGDSIKFFNGTNAVGSQKMVILNSGSVGINVTGPNSNTKLDVGGRVLIRTSTGVSDLYLGNYSTANYVRFHTNNADTYFDMNCGNVLWRQGSGVRFKHDMTAGTFTSSGDIIAYGSPSDIRLKENIKPIESALDKAMKLQGVTFNWKKSDSILDIKEDIGFIAQDVKEVVPELVRENKDGMLSMRHQGIAPILLEAIKELKAEIDLLKSKPCTCNNCNCNI